jgi:diadenosine tetraphosphatase ApaH/serine/threonine PP2A family protein phosphatase
MRIAFLADIHANREAFDAALDALPALAAGRIVVLGDLVGYGPDPGYVVDRVTELVEAGAFCLKGNHDEAAVTGPARGMNELARTAIEWTREQLNPAQIEFLDRLPLTIAEEDRLYVHASAHEPAAWRYVDNQAEAVLCLEASASRVIVCGHTHVPALFYALRGKQPSLFIPKPNRPAPLFRLCRHIVVAGSVGQPRDSNPAACIGMLDTVDSSFAMMRIPYDHDATMRKIAEAGLPVWLGMRLKIGR